MGQGASMDGSGQGTTAPNMNMTGSSGMLGQSPDQAMSGSLGNRPSNPPAMGSNSTAGGPLNPPNPPATGMMGQQPLQQSNNQQMPTRNGYAGQQARTYGGQQQQPTTPIQQLLGNQSLGQGSQQFPWMRWTQPY